MTTHTIPSGNWTQYLIDAIEQTDEGDTIVVESEAAAELGRKAVERMRPGLHVTFEVRPSDPFS